MDYDPFLGEMRFHRNTSCEQVEAANLRLLTLASSWRGSQNRKAINELVNGGLQHISKIALRYAARDRAMVAITATESPSRMLRKRKSTPRGATAATNALGPWAPRRAVPIP